LSKAVQFRTISNQDRSDFDGKAFEGYHKYLGPKLNNIVAD